MNTKKIQPKTTSFGDKEFIDSIRDAKAKLRPVTTNANKQQTEQTPQSTVFSKQQQPKPVTPTVVPSTPKWKTQFDNQKTTNNYFRFKNSKIESPDNKTAPPASSLSPPVNSTSVSFSFY